MAKNPTAAYVDSPVGPGLEPQRMADFPGFSNRYGFELGLHGAQGIAKGNAASPAVPRTGPAEKYPFTTLRRR